MNTKASVAYGWGVLIAAAGVSYYFAKKETNGRREEQMLKGTRPSEILTWEERIARTPDPSQVQTGGIPTKPSASVIPTAAATSTDGTNSILQSVSKGGTGKGDIDSKREAGR